MRLARMILGDPDPRSTREVERDIEDELAIHVRMIEDELRESGRDAAAAHDEAARRFGDVERYRRLCKRETLKERIMLQRINLALLVVVMLALGITAWQSWAGQARTAEAVTQLTKQLEAMNARTGATGAAGTGGVVSNGVVLVKGVIERAGQYLIPPGGLSLKRALVAAGWGGMVPIRVKIEREDEAAPRDITWEQIQKGEDLALANNDTITVYRVITDASTPAGVLHDEANPDNAIGATTPPLKPDAHGRVAELSLSARVVDRLAELSDECFKQYDQATTALGLTALSAKTDTVLVVGDVERPGVYLIDAVPNTGLPATLGDLARAAGAKPGANYLSLASSAVQGLTTVYVGQSFQRSAGSAAGMIVAVTTQNAEDPMKLFVQRAGPDGPWSILRPTFIGPESDEARRWAQTVDAIGGSNAERVDDRANVYPELIRGAIDVFPATGASNQPIRFLTQFDGHAAQPSSLADILMVLDKNATFSAGTVSITVRGKPEIARIDMPFEEAQKSDHMIQPASVIWIQPKNPALNRSSPFPKGRPSP